jgi:hypothetical protein
MVVFHGPGIERSLLIVKRVVAVGGDTVEEKGGPDLRQRGADLRLLLGSALP